VGRVMSDDNGNGDGSYRITVRDVYAAVQEIKTTLSDMSGTMREQSALNQMVTSEASRQSDDHETRLRILEARPWISWKQVSGAIFLLAVVVGSGAAAYPILHK
jgi:hypothetical protein